MAPGRKGWPFPVKGQVINNVHYSRFSLWEASGPEAGAGDTGKGTRSSPMALAPGCTYQEAA